MDCETSQVCGRWGEIVDDFSEDDENVVPEAVDDGVELLDDDDVAVLRNAAAEGDDIDMDGDVWEAAVRRYRIFDDAPVWGYVGQDAQQSSRNVNLPPYEPPVHMYQVDYNAMRDAEYESRVFCQASGSGEGDLELGALFDTKKDAQVAVKEYCVKRHMQFSVAESDSSTYYVRCSNYKSKCMWRIRVSYVKRKKMWEVTRFNEEHSCTMNSMSQDHINLDSDFICAMVKTLVEEEPRISIAVLVAFIRERFGYTPSYYKTWMGKQKAMTQIFGDWDKSYNEIPALLRAIQIFIPGSAVEYETLPALTLEGEVIPGKRIFSKLFWAFQPCIEGFTFCKRMIQIDGTWLYGKYNQILLIAVAQDGDRNIFPVAFAVVEKEDAEGWEFFLKHLRQHVTKEDGICVISDRGTALLSVIDRPGSLWKPPHAYPAYCVRHIAANAKRRFGNNEIRDEILSAGMV